jgi:glutamine synthetase
MATKLHPAVAAVQKSGAKVKVAVSDIDGILRGKYLHRDKFLGAAEPYPKGGFGFCDVVLGWDMMDVCYDNTTVTGWQHGFPDALARLDLDTARTCPGTTTCRSSWASSSTPTVHAARPACPRQTLKRVLKRAEKLGFKVMTGMEFEWFNFLETPQSWAAKKGVAPRC